MWPVLWVLKRCIGSTVGVAAASAVFWGILHSLVAPAWGLVVAWPFFVFSLCFLAWEERSVWRAIVATAVTHMCQNALPALALAVAS
jgi:biopolymer transport protein ExbB/TolQ